MRLFVSYARVDKPYCIQIVDTLSIHEVWFDQRLYAGQQWWREILRRLDWCQGFVYLLSPDSLASEYCRREYELAVSLRKDIFPVLVHEETVVPESLLDVQYADLSKGLTPEAVKLLLNSIHMTERDKKPSSAVSMDAIPAEDMRAPAISPSSVISLASQSMEGGQYDKAVFILRQAKASGYTSHYINLDAVLQEAEQGLERQSYLREAEREYRQITDLVKHQRTRNLGCEAYQAFARDYPDFDPDGLSKTCSEIGILPPASTNTQRPPMAISVSAHSNGSTFSLPLLEWIEIPAGMATIDHITKDGKTERRQYFVDAFRVSKYPVTNAQYQAFLDDPAGYANLSWWQYSPHAHSWRLSNPDPKASRFQGDERPRETVTWYEAMAFSHWLSARTGQKITLPTESQWQRAAQGDDDRRFPWGDDFDAARCNARESEIKMTTLVMRFPEGASAYGVYDMVGNVWEWCLDTKQDHEANIDITTADERAVHGGSFVSAHERSEILFRYHLQPHTAYASIGFRLVTTS